MEDYITCLIFLYLKSAIRNIESASVNATSSAMSTVQQSIQPTIHTDVTKFQTSNSSSNNLYTHSTLTLINYSQSSILKDSYNGSSSILDASVPNFSSISITKSSQTDARSVFQSNSSLCSSCSNYLNTKINSDFLSTFISSTKSRISNIIDDTTGVSNFIASTVETSTIPLTSSNAKKSLFVFSTYIPCWKTYYLSQSQVNKISQSSSIDLSVQIQHSTTENNLASEFRTDTLLPTFSSSIIKIEPSTTSMKTHSSVSKITSLSPSYTTNVGFQSTVQPSFSSIKTTASLNAFMTETLSAPPSLSAFDASINVSQSLMASSEWKPKLPSSSNVSTVSKSSDTSKYRNSTQISYSKTIQSMNSLSSLKASTNLSSSASNLLPTSLIESKQTNILSSRNMVSPSLSSERSNVISNSYNFVESTRSPNSSLHSSAKVELRSSLDVCLVVYTSIIHATLKPTISLTTSPVLTSVLKSLQSVLQTSTSTSNKLQSSAVSEKVSTSVLSPSKSNKLSTTSVIASSSITTIPPTTTTTTTTNNGGNVDVLLLTLLVDKQVDISASSFTTQLEKKLVDTFVYLRQSKIKRKRRAATNGDMEVKITKASRKSEVVAVEFDVREKDKPLPSSAVATTFNYLSVAGLEKRLGQKVVGPIQVTNLPTVSTLYKESDVLGMVIKNLTNATIQLQSIELKLASTYQNIDNNGSKYSSNIFYVKEELNQTVYIEFYIRSGLLVENASYAESQFLKLDNKNLLDGLGWELVTLPYASNSVLPYNQTNYVQMLLNSTQDLANEQLKTNVENSLSTVYLYGKFDKRNRRALSSIVTRITSFSGNSNNLNIVFIIIDSGNVQNGGTAAIVMNAVPLDTMQSILGAQVLSVPKPIMATVVEASEDPPYWIIGVVIGATLLVVLLCVCLLWRWKSGGPKKIQETPKEVVTEEVQEINNGTSPGKGNMSQFNAPPAQPSLLSLPREVSRERTSMRKKIGRKQKTTNNKSLFVDAPVPETNIYDEDGDDDIFEEVSEEESEKEEERISALKKSATTNRKLVYENVQAKEVAMTASEPPPLSHMSSTQEYPKPPSRKGLQQLSKRLSNLSPLARSNTVEPVKNDVQRTDDNLNYVSNSPQLVHHTAGHISAFGQIKESSEPSSQPALRFRRDIQQRQEEPLILATQAQPSFMLPTIEMRDDVHAQAKMVAPSSQINQPELNHKSDIERLRNKQRQREQMFSHKHSFNDSSRAESKISESDKKKLWRKQQRKINSVLDPVTNISQSELSSSSLPNRKSRARRRIRRKNKIYITPFQSASYKKDEQEEKDVSFDDDDSSQKDLMSPVPLVSDTESDISMREARRRIHSLLDDTFSTLKKHKKQLSKVEEVPPSNAFNANEINNANIVAPLASRGYPPLAPEAAPAHGRATTAMNNATRRKLLQQNPYAMSMMNNMAVPVESLLQLEPHERQRFINQGLGGYPLFGPPTGLAYSPGFQNMYVTPVQQRPDQMGDMIWSPQTNRDYIHHMQQNQPVNNLGMNSLQSKTNFVPFNNSIDRNHTVDPLVRSIKEELFKLTTPPKVYHQEIVGNVVETSNV